METDFGYRFALCLLVVSALGCASAPPAPRPRTPADHLADSRAVLREVSLTLVAAEQRGGRCGPEHRQAIERVVRDLREIQVGLSAIADALGQHELEWREPVEERQFEARVDELHEQVLRAKTRALLLQETLDQGCTRSGA